MQFYRYTYIMTLLNRYLNGETTAVYNELYALGQEALSPSNFAQTDSILKESFQRVKFNLEIIYNELKNINYQFIAGINDDWEKPLLPPDPNVDQLLSNIRSKIQGCGHIPLSLEYFYRIVGSCNFCWNWESKPDILWEGADPIDIPPITTLLNDLIYEDYDRDDILLSGDYLQKDNVSGSCYNIQLNSSRTVDSLLLHENWDIPFIEYLRITFDNCGFSMAAQSGYADLDSFCNRIRPLLKRI